MLQAVLSFITLICQVRYDRAWFLELHLGYFSLNDFHAWECVEGAKFKGTILMTNTGNAGRLLR